ncbi:DoxX family protein [Pseudoduganella lutea]|uniref:DoxX family protein n=1 Tax=Pseudoduganella lutea TaxID=321985 RepID=A0A4P6L6T7_9BURK|nr:DoxX family protein [Pseudoduganella lutea]QBE66602.1 DoxX family protein [Pseudoduganella lutea]
MNVVLRAVLTLLFWSAGMFGLFNFDAVATEVRELGLPQPALLAGATILLQLGGSLLVITNFRKLGWMGAFALAGFTLLTIPLGHAFWTFPEPRRTAELHIALEHITVIGGLLLAAYHSRRHD